MTRRRYGRLGGAILLVGMGVYVLCSAREARGARPEDPIVVDLDCPRPWENCRTRPIIDCWRPGLDDDCGGGPQTCSAASTASDGSGPLQPFSGSPLLQYRIVDTSGWPMLGRSDPAAPTGGWITDPVVIDTGELVFDSRDMSWRHDGTSIVANRIYRHQTLNPGGDTSDFGRYFHTNLRIVATIVDHSLFHDEVDVDAGNGEVLTFKKVLESSDYTSPAGWERLVMDKIGGTQYRITDRDGYAYYFEPDAYPDPANLISTQNRYGEGEDYDYDASGILTKITVAPSTFIFIDRDAADSITAIRDYAGRTVNYAYDDNSNLTKVEDACGSCSTLPTGEYLYDGSNRITVIKDGTGTTVRTIAYDDNQVDYYVDGTGNTFNFEYGSPEYAIDPEGNTSAYTFDGDGNMATKTLAHDTSIAATYIYEYDSGRRITKATLPNTAVSENTYDGRGNVLLSTVTADSVKITTYEATFDATHAVPLTEEQPAVEMTTFQYADAGEMTKATRSAWTGSRTYAYNAQGLKTQAIDATEHQIDYTYDSNGFLISKTVDSTLLTTYAVDDLGRVTSLTTPEGHASTTEFNKGGQVLKTTSASGIVTEYDFDDAGRGTARRIMDGETVLFTWTGTFDDAGRAISATSPDGTITTYAYDLVGRRTKTTDPEGGVAEQIYDALGRVITTKTGDGTSMINSRIVVYDNMNNVVTSTDAEGNQTLYEYDGHGRLITTADPAGHFSTYDYDDAGRQTAVKRYKSGGTILTHSVIEYDTLGRVTKTIRKDDPGNDDPNDDDGVTEMVYDDEDRLLTRKVHVDATAANETIYAYDGAGRQTKLTDPDAQDTTYAYDGDGRRTKVTDPNSNDTTYAYDADGRQTKVTNPLGDYTVTTFDDRGLRTDVSNYVSGGGTRLAQTVYKYDDNSRQTHSRRKVTPGGVGTEDDTKDFVVKSFYDTAGTLTKRTGASGNDTTYDYDAYGRRTTITLADGSYTTSSYNDNGRLTSQVRYELVSGSTRSFRTDHAIDVLGRVTKTTNQGPDGTFGNGDDLDLTYVYDGAGRRVTTTDQAGRDVLTEYDSLGRKTRVTEDDGGIGRVTDFTYDRAGRLGDLIAYTDGTTGPQTTSYAYNGRGLQTIVTYEETGDVTMDYDAAGNMTQRTDEAGVVVDYAYDTANRLTERKESESSTDIETYVYDALGRLITAEKGTSSNGDAVAGSAFTYDSLSRVNEECQSIAEGSGQAVSYAYDKAGNRTEVIYHGAATTANYAYDVRDRATSIDNGSQRLADYTWIGRAIHQRDTTCDYPGATKPKFKTAFERDGILRVTKVDNEHLTSDQATSGYNDLGEFAYTYDAASNPLTVLQANGMGKLDADRWYTYDTLNRVITSEYSDNQIWAIPQNHATSSYVYDDLGNRSSHSYRDAASIAYEHDKANRMTKLAGLDQGYDLAGNLTLAYSADRGTSYIYKYDHHNRLTAVWDDADSTRKAAFTYDALGRRIEHVNDVLSTTTRYFYDGVNEIIETDGGGDKMRYYIHGISYVDERLMMLDYKDTAESDDDRPYYYTIDRMYNVRFLVDRAGALVERYMYDAYGRPHIRESCGRGDMDNETTLTSTDSTRFTDAKNATIWDPRADMDDDGDIDANDQTDFDTKVGVWPPPNFGAPVVKQAFSDAGNPFMFQGRPHFALDTGASATEGKLMINDHRARPEGPVIGRWPARDPFYYNLDVLGPTSPGTSFVSTARLNARQKLPIIYGSRAANTYQFLASVPTKHRDPSGLCTVGATFAITGNGTRRCGFCGWWGPYERCQICLRCRFSFGPPPTTYWYRPPRTCSCSPLPPCPTGSPLGWGCDRWTQAPCNSSFCKTCCDEVFAPAWGDPPPFKNLFFCYTTCNNLPGC